MCEQVATPPSGGHLQKRPKLSIGLFFFKIVQI